MTVKHLLFLVVLAPLLVACPADPPEDGVLIFSKTEAYRHESIEAATAQLQYIGKQHDFWTEASEDASLFTSENLKRYKAVIFLCTTGDILNESQQQAFKEFINNGGGFVGIHSATDTEYDWPWYNKLVGAYFESHPDGEHDVTIHIIDTTHLSTKELPNPWQFHDELYNFKSMSSKVKVLATLDETTYEGGTHGDYHPISWFQEYDGGRVFYTGLGHLTESYSNDQFLTHVLGGIKYVLGR